MAHQSGLAGFSDAPSPDVIYTSTPRGGIFQDAQVVCAPIKAATSSPKLCSVATRRARNDVSFSKSQLHKDTCRIGLRRSGLLLYLST